ncbi:MAG: DEAD/DEAH box helicase family protein [Clostridia bacterium]|nr:DEAD/DEAH box helicase family protein [Clostridia bacterium]
MSEFQNSSYSVGKYLKRINETFKNEKNKSLSDILNDFRYMSEDFQKLNEQLTTNKITYSNARFDLCTIDEQKQFINNQLQLVETLVTDKIWYTEGIVVNWYDIFALMHNKDYANVDKKNRKVIFSTADSKRPIGDQAYNMWNGLQIIDIDIKDERIANGLKPILFDELKKFQWFLGVCLSSSKKSLHVWTKITPISRELSSRRIEFRCNFRQKYSYIYIILNKWKDKFGYSSEDIISYLDNAMGKPQQGIFIASDNAYMNTGFMDLRLDATFEAAIDTGIESINWITHPDLKQIFAKLEWFDNDTFNKENNIDLDNIENLEDRDLKKEKGPIHYKHNQRWQLANTLTALYGQDKALNIMCEICQGTERKELRGDVRTAYIHKKPISKWAIKELNEKHGFSIVIKEDIDEFKKSVEEADKAINETTNDNDPIRILNENTKKINLYITKDQYLSDIKEQIFGNLSKITLLEAGAGYGKTEMIKAFKSKVLLILPFTSIIKSKIELDESTSDWLYYYGSKKPTLEELCRKNQSMSMTIDKFSHLNLMEIDAAEFEYIVVDESHLLFTSSYRDVMSPTIQRLANCKAKVIMMTGTPTAETLFFPNITHIKVRKEETRIKEFITYMCPSEYEQLYEMAHSMAVDIRNGVKILWPTNRGTTYFEQITSIVEKLLREPTDEDRKEGIQPYTEKINTFYYKKSNYGDDSMDNINRNKSIGDNHIIGCTTYLSVGVDICDAKRFHVYFDDVIIAQDVEQYANRLRRNDLYIKMFLPRSVKGTLLDWDITRGLDLRLDEKELIFARDLVRTANDMIERNQDEAKYNPMILTMLTANKFLKYDEVDCKYYIDETAYKLKLFEERYTDYAKQLNVLKQGMQYYGYKVNTITTEKVIPDSYRTELDEEKQRVKHRRWDEMTIQVRKLLSQITDNNIDLYREVTKGNIAIFKDKGVNEIGESYEDIRNENELYCEKIEVLEKNIPIILSFYRFYTIDTIKEIYDFCIDKRSNRLNATKLDRIRRFVNIEHNKERHKLDFPILKFVTEARKFAKEHPTVTNMDILKWQSNYAISYANSISGLVVDDDKYINSIFDLVQNLWKVIIIQGRPIQGKISIAPFELLWQRKDILKNIYGDENTHEFFIQVLEDEMKKKAEEENDEDETLEEFKPASKVKLEDIKTEIPSIVHNGFEYEVYSVQDGSNRRFMIKQKNTYNPIAEEITKEEKKPKKETKKKIDDSDSLFKNEEFDATNEFLNQNE